MADPKDRTAPKHIETLRLFDSARGDLKGKFRFHQWELEHIARCAECQDVHEVFARQFTSLKPAS